MTNDPNIRKLESSASRIRECRYDESAPMRYDLMSDAILWEDELPAPPLGDALVLRLLLRYRTSVLLHQPDAQLEAYWDRGRMLFPDWPGFKLDRNTPSAAIAEYYRAHARASPT
jgi:hypothetical protein